LDDEYTCSGVWDRAAQFPDRHRRHDQDLAGRRLCSYCPDGFDGKILRRRWANAHSHFYCNSHGDRYSNGNTYTNVNSNIVANTYTLFCSYSHVYANADSGNAIGDAYVPAWGHTWAVEHGSTRTECSISRWWNDRRNLLLRLRWPNLHRRLPK